ncbi:MAG: type II toxin-antitoxin system death-on-curing family toxin [Rhodomicrobium sp.]
MAIIYLTIDDIGATHEKTVELSGGGQLGALELGKLESVLQHIQNDEYYPTFASKLTHLFFSLAKFHCFLDGNKRTAITASAHMLLVNGYLYCVKRFLHDMENISVQVADSIISKDLLGEIIGAQLAQDPDNEEVKLKILEAISAAAGSPFVEDIRQEPVDPKSRKLRQREEGVSAQGRKFIAAARDLGCTEDESAFDEIVKKVAKAPLPRQNEKPKKKGKISGSD